MFKNILKSVRAKLFITLCIVIIMIIAFFVIINNAVLEALYYYNKKEASLSTYNYINENIPKEFSEEDKNRYEIELEKIAENNNFEILILDKSLSEAKVLLLINQVYLNTNKKTNIP